MKPARNFGTGLLALWLIVHGLMAMLDLSFLRKRGGAGPARSCIENPDSS